MSYKPTFNIGDSVKNKRLMDEFKVANAGGMRKSNTYNCLVLISDHTKNSPYIDKWYGDVLHLTGMGKVGDQTFNSRGSNQNKALYESNENGIELHLFEVMKPKEYTYRGVVKLVEKPYQENQPDERGESRKVWMFPIRPLAGAPIIAKEDFIAKKIQQEIEMSKLTLEELRLKAILYSTDNPGTQKVVTTEYIRNTYVSEYAKRIANGTCQLCGKPAPFKDKNQLDYLETHHIIWLSNGGKDSLENVVALCPNCHRKMHIINDPNDVQILIDKALINSKPKWIS